MSHRNSIIKLIPKELNKIEKLLYGYNYECHFRLVKIVESTDVDLARKLIEERFNTAHSSNKKLEITSLEQALSKINYCLDYRGDNSAGVALNSEKGEKLKLHRDKLNKHLIEVFSEKSDIYIHPEIHTAIFWGFCYLIISKEENQTYILEGLASD